MNNSNVTIVDNIIDDNITLRYGGGILIGEGSTAIITGNTISRNVADTGGGVFVLRSTITMERNTVDRNVAILESGGGLSVLFNSTATVIGNTFTKNIASQFGGAIVAYDNAVVVLNGNNFVENEAEMGGAFIGFNSRLDVSDPDDNTYSGNVPEDIDHEDEDSAEKEGQ